MLLAADRVRLSAGLDLSQDQVRLARERLAGIANIRIQQGSFLEFDPAGERFTRALARKALHHLDDGQKALFFRRIGPMFASGALFLLEDGIFDFDRSELDARWAELLREAEQYYGDAWESRKNDIIHTFREEFPTGHEAWARAMAEGSFRVVERTRRNSFYGSILARRD